MLRAAGKLPGPWAAPMRPTSNRCLGAWMPFASLRPRNTTMPWCAPAWKRACTSWWKSRFPAPLEEADSLLELARAKKLVLQVGHLQRFNPAFQALAAQGGRPLFIDIERLAPFKARGTDVDVVLDLMIHDLDLVLALAKAPIEQVSASGFRVLTNAIDIANARIEFADGCIASVSASRVSQSPVRKLRVFRHDAYVSADLQEQRLRHVRKGGEGILESEQAFERADELRAQAEAFVEAVRGHAVPLVTGEQGRQALALALQVGRLVEERLARHGA